MNFLLSVVTFAISILRVDICGAWDAFFVPARIELHIGVLDEYVILILSLKRAWLRGLMGRVYLKSGVLQALGGGQRALLIWRGLLRVVLYY